MANLGGHADIYAETLRVFTDRDQPMKPLTTPEVAESLDCGRRAVHKRLQKLADRSELETKKVGAGARIWWRPETEATGNDRRRLQDLLTNAERLGDVGAWEYNVDTSELFWTDGARRIHGVDSEYEPTLESELGFFHPDDRPKIQQLLYTCIETGTPFSEELRLVTDEGEERWVRVSGESITDNGHAKIRGYIQDITTDKNYQRTLETQHENLDALNSLNTVVRQLTDAVLDQSTRAEIEATTCKQLNDSDSYQFAWIASIDPVTLEFVPRAEHGVDGYLDEAQLTANPTEKGGTGPAGRAVRTRAMQLSRDVFSDSDFEPWLDLAEKYDYRSMAAIPIVYEETLYGVLGIYSARVGAFANSEREVLEGIGEVVGHAIAAVDRKQALLSDEIVEFTFRMANAGSGVGLHPEFDASFTFDSTLDLGDGEFLVYCTATGVSDDEMQTLQESGPLQHVEDVTVLSEGADELSLEVRMADPPMLSTIANLGGYVSNVTIADGGITMTVNLAADQDVSAAIDRITSVEPDIEILRRHQMRRPDSSVDGSLHSLPDQLTDRQRAALEAAYFTGYLDWPREKTGTEVADTLGVSSSTFHQHLRKAERKLLDAVFS